MRQQSLEKIFSESQKGTISYQSDLLAFGREKGFQTIINRKLIWPYLLQVNPENFTNSIYEWDEQVDQSCNDFQQLQMDADRSLSNMKTFQSISKFHLQKRQKDVLKILNRFFAKNTDLRYIQGFHDVASIFVIIFGNNTGYYMVEKIGKTYFKDFLTKDVGTLGKIISELVMDLLVTKDHRFKAFFTSFVETKHITFLIPWVLTWFAHVYSSVKTICRIWDYLLCSGPHGIIFLSAGLILSTKDKLIAKCDTFDVASIQNFYQKLVIDEEVDIEAAIRMSIKLQESISIDSLRGYAYFDADSIFLNRNFELCIIIQRSVKQYDQKIKANRETLFKRIAIFSSLLIIGGLVFLRHTKKI